MLRGAAPGLLLGSASAIWCWWAAGPGLALFFGAVLLATLYAPGLVLAEEQLGRLAAGVAIAVGIAGVWAAAVGPNVSVGQWARCCAVMAAWVWALAGVAMLLTAARLPATAACALTITLGLLWLTWPVWFSHALTQRLVDWLVPAHPVLTLNAALKRFMPWDRAPLAYNALTVLNQDVSYRLSSSIWPAALLHIGIGLPGVALAATGWVHQLRQRPITAPGKSTVLPTEPAPAPSPAK